MGGHAAGELASSTTVAIVAQVDNNKEKLEDLESKLIETLNRLNSKSIDQQ